MTITKKQLRNMYENGKLSSARKRLVGKTVKYRVNAREYIGHITWVSDYGFNVGDDHGRHGFCNVDDIAKVW